MDFHLKQCRNLGESEQQHSGKISKFLAEPSASASALSLFVPDSNSKTSSSTILSAFPDYSTSSTTATAAALPNSKFKREKKKKKRTFFFGVTWFILLLIKLASWNIGQSFCIWVWEILLKFGFGFDLIFEYWILIDLFCWFVLGMWGYFSVAQRQELELQALIFRYMVAGAAVPPELLHSIKKSLLSSTPFFLHHPLQHFSHYPTSCKSLFLPFMHPISTSFNSHL